MSLSTRRLSWSDPDPTCPTWPDLRAAPSLLDPFTSVASSSGQSDPLMIPEHRPDGGRTFSTTQWTVVLGARDPASAESAAALEHLCRSYWHPLYFFARRKGSSPEDAQDSVQGFFEKLLEKEYLKSVARDKGRFRTFLLTAFSHFLANEWDSRHRTKRSGGATVISLDGIDAEERYRLEPADLLTPEKLFDRSWAETVVNLVTARLESELADSGEAKRFDALQSCLRGHTGDEGYAALGTKLGLSEGGVKTVVRRMRLRFAALLREELAQTLANPADVDTEMRHLLEALM